MDTQGQIFNYLLGKTGGKLLLTPQQLELETGISAKQQSVLRQLKKFPIPHRDVGGRVFYSIQAVVDFLINGEAVVVEQKQYQAKIKKLNPSLLKDKAKRLRMPFKT